MPPAHATPRRKVDPVVCLAVTLFVVVVTMELMLATWLPRRLRTERLWGRETALQELIEQVDWLRSHIRSRKYQDRWQQVEVGLVLDCADDIARYLREHQDSMTREQVRPLQDDIAFFSRSYELWGKANQRHFTSEELELDGWLEKQRGRLAGAIPEENEP